MIRFCGLCGSKYYYNFYQFFSSLQFKRLLRCEGCEEGPGSSRRLVVTISQSILCQSHEGGKRTQPADMTTARLAIWSSQTENLWTVRKMNGRGPLEQLLEEIKFQRRKELRSQVGRNWQALWTHLPPFRLDLYFASPRTISNVPFWGRFKNTSSNT